jgi:hypothetical protein
LQKDVFPKPSSYLRLDYPIAKYADFEWFTFEMNSEAVIKGEKDCGFTITYQNESDYLCLLQCIIISMSCCETLKVDIRARYKNDDILDSPI